MEREEREGGREGGRQLVFAVKRGVLARIHDGFKPYHVPQVLVRRLVSECFMVYRGGVPPNFS